jgi:hypothetical protein
MTNRAFRTKLLLALAIITSLSCADTTEQQRQVYTEVPYPDEVGPTTPFCQWRRADSGPGEPPPTGPEGTTPHEGSASFPLPESGSCADIEPDDVARAIIQEAEDECDAAIEGIERGCYRVFNADSEPECVFFAYYFSSCEPSSG